MPTLNQLRQDFHVAMFNDLYGHRLRSGNLVYKTVRGTQYTVWTNADSHNNVSVVLADGIAQRIGVPPTPIASQGSTLGSIFERITREFVHDALGLFAHLQARNLVTIPGTGIEHFAQYAHLDTVQTIV